MKDIPGYLWTHVRNMKACGITNITSHSGDILVGSIGTATAIVFTDDIDDATATIVTVDASKAETLAHMTSARILEYLRNKSVDITGNMPLTAIHI